MSELGSWPTIGGMSRHRAEASLRTSVHTSLRGSANQTCVLCSAIFPSRCAPNYRCASAPQVSGVRRARLDSRDINSPRRHPHERPLPDGGSLCCTAGDGRVRSRRCRGGGEQAVPSTWDARVGVNDRRCGRQCVSVLGISRDRYSVLADQPPTSGGLSDTVAA